MQKTRVAVLRGGPSTEYDVSLKSGASALTHLKDRHDVYDILIDKKGIWHYQGIPITPDELSRKVDVVVNAMHGEYGEDGKVQIVLERHNIPYTGSNSFSSAVGMNKAMTKSVFAQHGIKTPHHILVHKNDMTEEGVHKLFRSFPHPSIVKPSVGGSSIGVTLVKSYNDLLQGLHKAFEHCDTVVMEEFIDGKEATVGVVNNFRGEELYSLIPVEIRKPKESAFFDYEAKYSGKSEEICPGNFTSDEKTTLQKIAQQIHKALGLRHYSRSDFIVHPKRGIYALEVNTLPGLTSESLLPKSLASVGCTLPEFLDHLVNQALTNK